LHLSRDWNLLCGPLGQGNRNAMPAFFEKTDHFPPESAGGSDSFVSRRARRAVFSNVTKTAFFYHPVMALY